MLLEQQNKWQNPICFNEKWPSEFKVHSTHEKQASNNGFNFSHDWASLLFENYLRALVNLDVRFGNNSPKS